MAHQDLHLSGTSVALHRLHQEAAARGVDLASLPYAIRTMVENLLRHQASGGATEDDLQSALNWRQNKGRGIPLHVTRVILPDSSGIPVLQGIATLRDAVDTAGGDPLTVEPRVPVDVIVDHSLQVDHFGSKDAEALNLAVEFHRNDERYRFLKWAEQAFDNITVHPPGSGIIHQLNLEKIATVIAVSGPEHTKTAHPEFVLGGDSHTPMVNALGVLGWGVGGLDAEAAMLGYPHVYPMPEVVGLRLNGRLGPGVTTTDLALTATQRLRAEGVIAAIVEYIGEGVSSLSVPERATLANMAPEYGATAGFFPVDAQTLTYLNATRSPEHARFVEDYCRANGLLRETSTPEPSYSRVIEIDLSEVKRSVAGPARPQDRLALPQVAQDFRRRLELSKTEGGFAAKPAAQSGLTHGALAIAAITACTNTSNPSVMIAAGLIAKRATELGLQVPAHVKTSLAPGSRNVARYLDELGLLSALAEIGFHVIGYGCTTCGGKSGPLVPAMAETIDQGELVAAAALSGNRNFEGRIHRQIRANYIMSPPLVIAFALAGRIDIDLETEPLGLNAKGQPVMLADLWPADDTVAALVAAAAKPQPSPNPVQTVGSQLWQSLQAPVGPRFAWDASSSYLLPSPFFDKAAGAGDRSDEIAGARVLGAYGDSLTTDHISPGGEIPMDSAAGLYLQSLGIERQAFNTYVARRCNHEVMARATFANLRIKNLLVPEVEGGVTRLLPEMEMMTVHAAAEVYRHRGLPLVVLGGKEYGTGSSRDWAAKGSVLLGVQAVIAESFERIHRSNLVSLGILPLRFQPGEGWRQLGLTGQEPITITGIRNAIARGAPLQVQAGEVAFTVTLDASTESERQLLSNGGLLRAVLNDFVGDAAPAAQKDAQA
ncbi:aconitate hydratase AcnA [Xinfangfangia sp. CPCC 101601]|uniref:Aconitate hydratase n=1 Tax=Pseudogemmobacter lacusdianii TaxID=3069608 RepID=A0ABU0W389_9RHOB|nr:aconitate hydratase AcnA [Xinfangfangia sp. CPCC 101601]MDQ2067930.1 aconitate hydratase AcnA [Xinfangfangia sp. CPCC 101601]